MMEEDEKDCHCCCHKHGSMGMDKSEWEEKYKAMSPEEKKEMLMKKQEKIEKKLAWVKEELAKLN